MPRPVHTFCGLVSAVGGAVLVVALVQHGALTSAWSLSAILMAVGLFAGELLPLKIPRRGEDEEIAISTTFAFALLLGAGFVPAVLAQVVASAVQDRASGKPLWRITFNIGQYTLSLAAAALVLSELSGIPHEHGPAFSGGDLPAILAAAATFFVVNTGLVRVAIALYQGTRILPFLRTDLAFNVSIGGVLLAMAPVVEAALSYTPALFPLFAAPLIALYHGGVQAVRAEYQASHDALTDLPNRTHFAQLVSRWLAGANGSSRGAVMILDLNRFKEVNDTLGHHHGDLLLQEAATRLAGTFAGDGAVVGRLGGDEFAVFVPGAGRDDAAALAARTHAGLQTPFDLEGIVLEIDASIGIAVAPDDGASVEVLLQRADVGMYQAKRTHVPWALYDARHDVHNPARLALVGELRRGIAGGELVLFYQPKISLRDGALCGAEALVRWQHPTFGLLSPSAFIELAERTRLIKPLTLWVLDEALRQRAEWRTRGLDVRVAVNVSARSLTDPRLPADLAALLDRHGVAPGDLLLEVTETSMMADPQGAGEAIRALTSTGIPLSIDDFGTGYSSFGQLTQLPFSQIKIDRTFVANVLTSPGDEAIVRSIVDLGHHLDLEVVAEGVEDARTLTALRTLGCDTAQGYHFTAPVPAAQLEDWIRSSQPHWRRELAPWPAHLTLAKAQ